MVIGVLGAGSWGAALAIAMSKVASVRLWSRNDNQVQQINLTHMNQGYLPEVIKFPSNVIATSDLVWAIDVDLIVVAVPISALRTIINIIKEHYSNNVFPDVIWVCKGFEVGSSLLPHQIIAEVLPRFDNIGALIGPSFAKEVAEGKPTAITLASKNLQFALKWVELLKPIPNFRVYANTDVMGAEIGAAVKNIMAIAVGISDGLNLGYNARAALITRSLNEIKQLVVLMGGSSETIYGLTGVGDLILTCTGELSRNRQVGLKLAGGQKVEAILAELGHVAEGVNATQEAYRLSLNLNLDMPIVETVYKILFEQADILNSVTNLLKREPKLEFTSFS